MSIQEVGKEVLRVMQRLDPQAVIAGGWARDILLGRQPKDVDIWMYLEQPDVAVAAAEVAATMWAGFETSAHDVESRGLLISEYGSPSAVWSRGVSKWRVGGYDVDVILFTTPVGALGETVVHQFDFAICQAAYHSDDNGIIGTEGFWQDVHNKTLTFQEAARTREDLHRVVGDHLTRLRQKFPEHAVRNLPDDLESILAQDRVDPGFTFLPGWRAVGGGGFGGGY